MICVMMLQVPLTTGDAVHRLQLLRRWSDTRQHDPACCHLIALPLRSRPSPDPIIWAALFSRLFPRIRSTLSHLPHNPHPQTGNLVLLTGRLSLPFHSALSAPSVNSPGLATARPSAAPTCRCGSGLGSSTSPSRQSASAGASSTNIYHLSSALFGLAIS